MKKNILLLFLLSIISCQKQAAKKNDNVIVYHHDKNSVNFIGIYKGILPCADCEGIETTITLNENFTYSIAAKYLGKGEKVFVKKGTFSRNKSGNIIICNIQKNVPHLYFIDKNSLTQLDISGKKITGSRASDYILAKQKAVFNDIENESQPKTTVDLNNRMEVTATIQKVNPAAGKFTLAETKWELKAINGKAISSKNKKYFLKLNSKDGRFTAFVGCNSIAGDYVMPTFNTLDFSEVIMTRMACKDMTLEDQFGAMLVQVKNYKLDEETLILLGERKKELAKFEAISK